MRNKKKKVIALSVVALVLASLVVFGLTTYAWIDDVKLVEFKNNDAAQNNAPLKTGTDINATVNINKTDNTIDLGNMLTNSDLMFQYEKDGNQYVLGDYDEEVEEATRHIKYDTENGGTKKDPKWVDVDNEKGINSKKGYFYESGDMHLSGCYSDGETFYFPRQGQSGYREGNKDDENVNYISFTVKVSSPDATTDFWFRNEPSVYIKDTNTKIANARYAIIVDGQAHVYSSTGTANTCNASLNGTQQVQGVRKTSTYTYNHSDNTTSERGKNSNTLFSIKKGNTVNLTVKIWLENGFSSSIIASDINLQLVSSWAYTRKLWIEDKTTGGAGESWLNNPPEAPAKLYLTFPEFLKDAASVSDWPNASSGFYPLTVDDSTHKGYVEVPLVYNNEKMILYRCNNSQIGWNNNASGTVQRSDYNVYCWNWWQTYTPNTFKDETYTLYGGSMDSTANGYFKSINQGFTVTNKGYGTWGAVVEINVKSVYNSHDLASKGDRKALYVVDYSDEDASGEKYIYEMYRGGTTASDHWKTYIPVTSAKIQFRYFGGTSGLSWGYNSWNNTNPQRRPLASTGLYPNDATTYQLGAIYDNVNGWGFWEDDSGSSAIYYDRVYLVKNGIFREKSSLYANMYDGVGNGNGGGWPGVQMTRMKDASNNDVTWKDNSSPVMQSDPARNGDSTIYKLVKFNDGNSTYDSATKTGELAVFPGCFYSPADNDGNGKWYGAINDTGRDASSSSGTTGGGGESTGGEGTIEGYTIESDFTVQLGGHTYTVYQNSDGTSFKVILPLASGDNWTTFQKSGINYGLQASGQHYYIPENGSLNINIFRKVSNNISLRATSAGNYLVTFAYENGNTGTVNISSAEKQS